VWLVHAIFGVLIMAGLGAAFVFLIWNRDELIIGDNELSSDIDD